MLAKECRKTLKIIELLTCCQVNDHERFSRSCKLLQKLSLRLWRERQNLTQRIASISIRQESLRRPSIADRRRKYSPEGTCVIPRERYASYFVLKTSIIWEESKVVLFIPYPKYWYRIQIYFLQLMTSQELFIHTGYKLFTLFRELDKHWLKEIFVPDPKYCINTGFDTIYLS